MKTLLFNPISIVHDRGMDVFRGRLPGWRIRCIYNPRFPWFATGEKRGSEEALFFTGGYFQKPPAGALDDAGAVVLFTAQARVPPCGLIEEAALRSVPVIAVEEVYQMMLEQGMVNNYFLPVDHLFAASDYERERFIETGVAEDVVETTGCVSGRDKPRSVDTSGKESIKKALGLVGGKDVVTLCLARVTPSGETAEIRKRLLTLAQEGLPDGCQLLIKPHPHELDKNFKDVVKRCAPSAAIADPHTPFDKILRATDLVLNRGNSQVLIDALQGGVPVAVIPVGRKTLFHGLFDEVIINEKSDLGRVLAMVKRGGTGLYKRVFDMYLSISSDEAAEKATSRISRIAEDRDLYRPDERLAELALFWAWMGYGRKALETLIRAKKASGHNAVLENIRALILCKADRRGLAILNKYYASPYRQWILKSLWIKSLYKRGNRLEPEDAAWLSGYPPRMNRTSFLPYAALLYWCYARSGRDTQAESLLEELYGEYGSSFGYIKRLKPRANYWRERLDYDATLACRDIQWMMGAFAR